MTPLQKIAIQCGEPDLPQRIIDACHNQQAFLFVRGDDGFVLRPEVVDGEVEVLVWLGWGSGGAPARHLEEGKRLSRMIGARRIRFHTSRKGFLRTAPAMGFHRDADDERGRFVFTMTL